MNTTIANRLHDLQKRKVLENLEGATKEVQQIKIIRALDEMATDTAQYSLYGSKPVVPDKVFTDFIENWKPSYIDKEILQNLNPNEKAFVGQIAKAFDVNQATNKGFLKLNDGNSILYRAKDEAVQKAMQLYKNIDNPRIDMWTGSDDAGKRVLYAEVDGKQLSFHGIKEIPEWIPEGSKKWNGKINYINPLYDSKLVMGGKLEKSYNNEEE